MASNLEVIKPSNLLQKASIYNTSIGHNDHNYDIHIATPYMPQMQIEFGPFVM